MLPIPEQYARHVVLCMTTCVDYHWGWIYETQAHDCLTTGASSMQFDYESALIRPAGVFVAYTALSTLARKLRSSLQ